MLVNLVCLLEVFCALKHKSTVMEAFRCHLGNLKNKSILVKLSSLLQVECPLVLIIRPSKINIKIPGTRPTLSITAELENFITSSMADTISLAGTSQGVDNKRR